MSAFYKEHQKFTQIWLWVILIAGIVPAIGFLTFGFIQQLLFGIAWGDKPMSNIGLTILTIVIWIICGGIFWMFMVSELQLEIRDKAIYYRFPVFSSTMKRIGMESLESWEVRRYGFFEYGGYGVKHTLKRKTAFIVRGNMGLELKLKDGKTVMIGTQRPEELEIAMQKELDRNTENY